MIFWYGISPTAASLQVRLSSLFLMAAQCCWGGRERREGSAFLLHGHQMPHQFTALKVCLACQRCRWHFKIEPSKFTLLLIIWFCTVFVHTNALFSAVCQLWQANIASLAACDTSSQLACSNLPSSCQQPSCQQPSCCPAAAADCSEPQVAVRSLHQQPGEGGTAGKVGSNPPEKAGYEPVAR